MKNGVRAGAEVLQTRNRAGRRRRRDGRGLCLGLRARRPGWRRGAGGRLCDVAQGAGERGAGGSRCCGSTTRRSPSGSGTRCARTRAGCYVKGRVLTDVARGREAAALIGAGAIDGLSIGYRTVQRRARMRRGGGFLRSWSFGRCRWSPSRCFPKRGWRRRARRPTTLLRDLAAAFDEARRLTGRALRRRHDHPCEGQDDDQDRDQGPGRSRHARSCAADGRGEGRAGRFPGGFQALSRTTSKPTLQQQEERLTMLDRKTMTAGPTGPFAQPPRSRRRTRRPSTPICAPATTTRCAAWSWRARR